MSSFYQKKTVGESTLDVDDKSRRVKVAISHTGSLDSDKDIIEAGAFTKTIKERGPKAANLIWHLTDHNPSLKSAVGKFTELKMEGEFLVGITDIPNTNWGNDVLEFYKTGHINQHSIGFSTIKREVMNDDDWSKRYTIIKEVALYEGSAVLWGANQNTPTLTVGKSIEEQQTEISNLQNRLTQITKSIKEGSFTDETFELLDMQMKQIQQSINDLFATQPVKTVEPSYKDELEAIKQFTNSLNIK